jgi:cytochrome c-type biogenesis protein CcmH/NrfG
VHQAKIKELRNWISDELLQLRDNLRTSKTLLIYHSQDTDFRRDRVRDAIQKFKEEEELLLRERNLASQSRAKEVERSVSVRIGGFVLVMAVLFMLVMRESKKLRIAERSALHAQARLEGSLERLQSETESSKCLNELQADLQICVNASEAFDVLSGYSQRLLPASAGAVFAIDNTHNLMGTFAKPSCSGRLLRHARQPSACAFAGSEVAFLSSFQWHHSTRVYLSAVVRTGRDTGHSAHQRG